METITMEVETEIARAYQEINLMERKKCRSFSIFFLNSLCIGNPENLLN